MPPEDMPDPFADETNQTISWSYAIRQQCEMVRDGLLKHNDKYGSSIFRPHTILSSSTTEEALRMRIDDRIRKLSKCTNKEQEKELVDDLIGFLINFRAFMFTHEPETWKVFE